MHIVLRGGYVEGEGERAVQFGSGIRNPVRRGRGVICEEKYENQESRSKTRCWSD